jgi:zinc protease
VVNGQFTPAEVEKLAAELFGNWKSPGSYTRVTESYQKYEPIERTIEAPDKPNAMFLGAVVTKMTDADPDYPGMVLANYIFGGSAGSRLFKRVRDKEGLSYGVNSGFSVPAQEDRAMFSINAISNPQNAPKVEVSIKDELARTLKDGFTEDEVAAAKKSLLELQMVGRSQDAQLLTILMTRERFGRTLKWDEALEAKIGALTAQQVSEAFRRHVDAAALTYVKAGDFKKAGVFQQ